MPSQAASSLASLFPPCPKPSQIEPSVCKIEESVRAAHSHAGTTSAAATPRRRRVASADRVFIVFCMRKLCFGGELVTSSKARL